MIALWRANIEHGEIEFGPANAEAKAAVERGEMPWGRELGIAAAAAAIPVCPICGAQLTARPHDRRFTENNSYLECWSGHVFQLAAADAEEAVDDALEWCDVYEDNMVSGDFEKRRAAIKRARDAVSRLFPSVRKDNDR